MTHWHFYYVRFWFSVTLCRAFWSAVADSVAGQNKAKILTVWTIYHLCILILAWKNAHFFATSTLCFRKQHRESFPESQGMPTWPSDHGPITQQQQQQHTVQLFTLNWIPLCHSQIYCSHHYDWWGLWLPYKAPCPGGLRRGEDHLPVPIHRQQVQPQIYHHGWHWLQGKESGEFCCLSGQAFWHVFVLDMFILRTGDTCSVTIVTMSVVQALSLVCTY